MQLMSGKTRWLYLLPLLFIALIFIYFRHADEEVTKALLEEKYVVIQESVEMLTASVDADARRERSGYGDNIRDAVEYLDNLDQIFAAAYKVTGDKLELITDRNFETSIFEPLDYPEFRKAIENDASGKLVIGYTPERQTYRDLHLYFRWMPTFEGAEEHFLVVAGVSKYSVATSVPVWISSRVWAVCSLTFILNVFLIAEIVQLGHVWAARKGDEKWRPLPHGGQ